MSLKEYYKKKLVNNNIEVEYSSETDEITIRIERKLNSGDVIGTEHLKIHPSYIKPLMQLLNEVSPTQNDGEAKT